MIDGKMIDIESMTYQYLLLIYISSQKKKPNYFPLEAIPGLWSHIWFLFSLLSHIWFPISTPQIWFPVSLLSQICFLVSMLSCIWFPILLFSCIWFPVFLLSLISSFSALPHLISSLYPLLYLIPALLPLFRVLLFNRTSSTLFSQSYTTLEIQHDQNLEFKILPDW